jgi:ATP-binding cassette subfamily B protein
VRPWRRQLLVVGSLVVADALVELVPPFAVRAVVNNNLVPHHSQGLLLAAVLYVGAVAGDAALTYGYTFTAARVSQGVIARLRTRLFGHLVSLPTAYFDHTPVGDAISRATADVETIDELFTGGIVTLVGQLVPLVAIVVAMLVLSPQLTLVAAIAVPPLVLIARFLQVRVRDAERETRRAVGRLNVELAETIGGAETVRVFGRAEAFAARFRGALERTLRAQDESIKYNAYFAPVTGLLASLVIALLLWIGAGAAIAGVGVNLGTLTAFVLLFQSFFAPLLALGDEWQSVQAAFAGVERVFEVLDLEPEPVASRATFAHAGGIVIDRVGFHYLEGRSVLSNVSLHVDPGELVAVVGRSGAGKSTLVSLLAGLRAPTSGTVRVGGVDPMTIDETERRSKIGVMAQALELFTGTVRENVTVFDASIDPATVDDALGFVGVRSAIDRLPEGADSVIAGQGKGEGMGLSTGQRQLVALARTVVAQPRVLLLDEATASIDGASDAAFRRALRASAASRGCAVLMVAHRIATARDADRVVVLEHGRVVEEGPPLVLLAAAGRFAALAELEAAGWDWQDPEEPDSGDLAVASGREGTSP